ncbi:MAG: FHA domain-containing protein [Acidobacteriota bacterium]
MEAAKFCGNCGTPFPRSPVPSSSLVNCPQGHIYSAVYEHCPYCPQPEQAKSTDFATRVEGSETIVETASLSTPQQPMPVPAHAEFATRIESPIAAEMTVIEPGLAAAEEVANGRDVPSPPSQSRPPATDLTETVISQPAPPVETPAPPPLRAVRPTPDVPPPPPPPRPVRESHTADQPDRRTVVVASVADDSPSKGKGKIIGWLITYTRHQEGVDYKLRTGFNRIGAHPACDLVMEDETVSSSHAVIVQRDGRCLIKDELSRNGTFVNGVEVTEARVLQNYDQIRVGNTTLTFILADKPA